MSESLRILFIPVTGAVSEEPGDREKWTRAQLLIFHCRERRIHIPEG